MIMKNLYITILALFALLTPTSVFGEHTLSNELVPVCSQSIQSYKMRSVAPMRTNQMTGNQAVEKSVNTVSTYNTSMELYTKSKVRKTTQSAVSVAGTGANTTSLWTSSLNPIGENQPNISIASSAPTMYGLVGPGVPDVPEDEIIPLGLEWDVLFLMILMAFVYAIFVARKQCTVIYNRKP